MLAHLTQRQHTPTERHIQTLSHTDKREVIHNKEWYIKLHYLINKYLHNCKYVTVCLIWGSSRDLETLDNALMCLAGHIRTGKHAPFLCFLEAPEAVWEHITFLLWPLEPPKIHENFLPFWEAAWEHGAASSGASQKTMQEHSCTIFRGSKSCVRAKSSCTTSRWSGGYTSIHKIFMQPLGMSPKMIWHVTCDTHVIGSPPLL